MSVESFSIWVWEAHPFMSCANCCTRPNAASELRMPYSPAPPPSAAGATCAVRVPTVILLLHVHFMLAWRFLQRDAQLQLHNACWLLSANQVLLPFMFAASSHAVHATEAGVPGQPE